MKERKKRRTRKRCRARAGANRSHGREESRLPRVGTTLLLLLLHHKTFKNISASHSAIARRRRCTNQTSRRSTLDCNYTHTHTHTHIHTHTHTRTHTHQPTI